MRRHWIMTVIGIVLGGAGCAAWQPGAPQAIAELKNAAGDVVARASFWTEGEAVRIAVSAEKLPPGPHGMHLHAVGKCDPPDFMTAGAHFNPAGMKHGSLNPEGSHAGDLPNLEIGPDGKGALRLQTRSVTLGPGAASVFDADGTALVIHAGPDDYRTDPAGNSGGRIACGVLTRTP